MLITWNYLNLLRKIQDKHPSTPPCFASINCWFSPCLPLPTSKAKWIPTHLSALHIVNSIWADGGFTKFKNHLSLQLDLTMPTILLGVNNIFSILQFS